MNRKEICFLTDSVEELMVSVPHEGQAGEISLANCGWLVRKSVDKKRENVQLKAN